MTSAKQGRLKAVANHVLLSSTSASLLCESGWRSVLRREWRTGDRFVLMPDPAGLENLCERYGVAFGPLASDAQARATKQISPDGAIGAEFCGLYGQFVRIARGDPVAMVTFFEQQIEEDLNGSAKQKAITWPMVSETLRGSWQKSVGPDTRGIRARNPSASGPVSNIHNRTKRTKANRSKRALRFLIPVAAAGRLDVAKVPMEVHDQAYDDGAPIDTGEEDDTTCAQIAALSLQEGLMKLPIALCEHAMLPMQSFVLYCSNDEQILMIRSCIRSGSKTFGIIGHDPSNGRQLLTGVEAKIMKIGRFTGPAEHDDRVVVYIKTSRQFELWDGLHSIWRDQTGGYTVGLVQWSEDDDANDDDNCSQPMDTSWAMVPDCTVSYYSQLASSRVRTSKEWMALTNMALVLSTLVDTWTDLIRQGGHERLVVKVDRVLSELGPMPNPQNRPGALSLWVGALINPQAGLDVAQDVRAGLLQAVSSEERVWLVTKTILESVANLKTMSHR